MENMNVQNDSNFPMEEKNQMNLQGDLQIMQAMQGGLPPPNMGMGMPLMGPEGMQQHP